MWSFSVIQTTCLLLTTWRAIREYKGTHKTNIQEVLKVIKSKIETAKETEQDETLFIPDTQEIEMLLDNIYKTVGKMKPSIKELNEFTETLAQLKQEVSLNSFKTGLDIGMRINEKETDEPEPKMYQA